MSDHWIVLLPEDPAHVPDVRVQRVLRERLEEMVRADEVRVVVSESVQFFDAGANFERVRCPSCGDELSLAWWQGRMDADYAGGFALAPYATPCCGSMRTLNELIYEWPAGFARFALQAMNPAMTTITVEQQHALEHVLGAKLRVIYARL